MTLTPAEQEQQIKLEEDIERRIAKLREWHKMDDARWKEFVEAMDAIIRASGEKP